MTTRRRTPDELLKLVQAEAESETRGRLKVFLGYASGVGKSFRMFDEGRRRRERGQDVVVAAVQPRTTPEIDDLLRNFEVIPLAEKGGDLVMDVPAILRRRPAVCLVDGLAYDNPPGSHNAHRWQDVGDLLAGGLSVITTINIQYIEELRDRVQKLTGKAVQQTVPQAFLDTADEIVVVDAPPEMCLGRASGGTTDSSFARTLSELREIALLLVADVVDHQLDNYLQRNGIALTFGAQERILVCVTPRANARIMVESGRRTAERFHGELIVTYVEQHSLAPQDQAALDHNLALARDAGAEIAILDGDDPVDTILQFARRRGVTQIFLGHSLQGGWWQRVAGSPVDKLIRGADGIDVRVFPH